MIRFHYLSSGLVLLAIVLAACAPKASPTPAATEPPATELPTEAPAEPVEESTPTLVPINLAGPEMAVGSKFLYVDGTTLVAVPGGPFMMGRGGGSDNPIREVTLSDFWIYRTEVTNEQYDYCIRVGKCSAPDLDDNPSFLDPARVGDPVTGVTWHQANEYCEFVHGRLPTEAEWEKTASWDPLNQTKNIYPWGDAAPSCALVNFNNCIGKTTGVLTYPQGQSAYEALDMAGNSYEWVADWYDPLFYKTGSAQDPTGAEEGDRRSIRSGSYKSNQDQVPAAVRAFDNPNTHSRDRGFRCVVEDPTWYAPMCEMLVHYGLDGGGSSGSGGGYLECPDPSISAGSDCGENNTAVSYVKVHVDAPSVITSITGFESCIPNTATADEVHACPIGTTIHAEAACSLAVPVGGGCPAGWTLNPDGTSCLSEGGPGEACPEGYEYDPLLQCCALIPGNPGWQCASGFHEYNGGCVADVYGLVQPSPATLTTIATGNALQCGDPGGGQCSEPKDPGCTYPYVYDGQCGCTCSWGPGECTRYNPD